MHRVTLIILPCEEKPVEKRKQQAMGYDVFTGIRLQSHCAVSTSGVLLRGSQGTLNKLFEAGQPCESIPASSLWQKEGIGESRQEHEETQLGIGTLETRILLSDH